MEDEGDERLHEHSVREKISCHAVDRSLPSLLCCSVLLLIQSTEIELAPGRIPDVTDFQ